MVVFILGQNATFPKVAAGNRGVGHSKETNTAFQLKAIGIQGDVATRSSPVSHSILRQHSSLTVILKPTRLNPSLSGNVQH